MQLEVRESMIIPAEVNIHRTDDIVVAVLDTGIRDCHPDFQVRIPTLYKKPVWEVKKPSHRFVRFIDHQCHSDNRAVG